MTLEYKRKQLILLKGPMEGFRKCQYLNWTLLAKYEKCQWAKFWCIARAENSNRGSKFSRSPDMRASGTYKAATCSIFGRVAGGINREVQRANL